MSSAQVYLVGKGENERSIRVRRIADTSAGGVRYGLSINDGPEFEVDAARPVEDVLSLVHQGRIWEAGLVKIEDGYEVEVVGIIHPLEVMDPRKKALRMADAGTENRIKTQMPGRIVRVLVAEGDDVVEGQPVIVVEAMKMENELKAPCDGTVSKLCVAEGDQVAARDVLVEFNP